MVYRWRWEKILRTNKTSFTKPLRCLIISYSQNCDNLRSHIEKTSWFSRIKLIISFTNY